LPINFLASVKSLKCVFSIYSSAVWKNGEPQAQVKPTEIMLTFTAVDARAPNF